VRAEDFLWSVRAQEAALKEQLDRDVATLEAAYQATSELSALASNPNFHAFLGKVRVLYEDQMAKLRDHVGMDHEVRQAQGRCQALKSILSLCQDTRTRADELAKKLAAAQDARQRVIRPDGSAVPQGIIP
jgi:hypothetical protein